MQVFRNPHRLRELFTEEGVERAAQAILSLNRKGVLKVLCYGWGLVLLMVLSLLLVVRLALSLPLPWGT